MTMHLKLATAAAITALCALAPGVASAKVLAYGSYASNFSFTDATALAPLQSDGKTNILFKVTGTTNAVVAITFSAECSVDAPDGDVASWIDVDVLVDDVAVAPTGITSDGFCSADGSAGFSGWVRPSITVAVELAPGNHRVKVRGRRDFNATGGWLSDTATVIEQ